MVKCAIKRNIDFMFTWCMYKLGNVQCSYIYKQDLIWNMNMITDVPCIMWLVEYSPPPPPRVCWWNGGRGGWILYSSNYDEWSHCWLWIQSFGGPQWSCTLLDDWPMACFAQLGRSYRCTEDSGDAEHRNSKAQKSEFKLSPNDICPWLFVLISNQSFFLSLST